MGYYTINISPEICNLTTIVIEFEKFRYNIVPMGLCASSDTFKAKVDKIIGCIESVKTYINNIIVLGKGTLYQQYYQIRVVFAVLHVSGLKFNTPRCSFGLKGIPYLDYPLLGKGLNLILIKYRGSWISGNLTQRLKCKFSLGWSITIGTCGPGGHMYWRLWKKLLEKLRVDKYF